MLRTNRLVPLIGLTLVATFTLAACSLKLGGGSSEPSTVASSSASAPSSSTPTTQTVSNKQPTVKDAEKTATLDERLWGHLTWKYPTRYTNLVTEYYGTDGVQKLKKDTFPVFVVGSNEPGKVWTDAVRPPLVPTSMEYVYANILSEPDYGAQVGSGLAQSTIMGGKSLLELNPWLREFNDPAGINDWAQAAMDGSSAEQLVAAKKLVLVVMLLEQLRDEKIETRATSLNYRLVVGEAGSAMTVNPNNPDAVKEFELSPVQYVGKFVTVQLTYKGQTGCWLKVGFNTGDGRFAGFACETPKPPTPPVTPPTGCVTNCGSPTPRCTSNCGETPGCKSNCTPVCPSTKCLTPKDPKNDVTPPQGTTLLGRDQLQPTAPTPKPKPLDPTTPVTADPGPLVPVQGAKPAPPAPPAPSIPAPQQPTPTAPGTPIKDPDS
ncbi:MAG: hypothetical protein EOT05_00295 [Candidatus Microsaccharimonas sossegonensis]|uniref:Uncharacterized protein n=1 Tax=Candidatus Microsaccharimonas sossegonensis TaxID=2506948 RepID=A0A4Q0AHY2_9BACT|nr:MAG: hypothetical protein EOT05_00295 [Candidatus Microsaccharimonas sossegonensis]